MSDDKQSGGDGRKPPRGPKRASSSEQATSGDRPTRAASGDDAPRRRGRVGGADAGSEREAPEPRFEERRERRTGAPASRAPRADRGDRPFKAREDRGDRPFKPREDRGDRPFRPREERGDRPFKAREDRGDRPFRPREERGDRPFKPREDRGDRPFKPREDRGDRPFRPREERGDRPFKAREDRGDRPFKPREERGDRPFKPREDRGERSFRPRQDRADRPRPERTERPAREAVPAVAEVTETVSAFEGERVAKVIARSGLGSRRDAEAWIEAGRVAVNGEVLESAARNVTASDKVTVDGVALPRRERTRLWLFHKPRGLVTSEKDPEGRPTVFDNLPPGLPRVVSVGRLDINTEGLLLLTNDGGLARVLELPKTGWLRRYRVRAHGETDQAVLDGLANGVTVDGIDYGPIEARMDREQGENVWLSIGLREGKNREVKNVLGSIGLEVNRLIRISYGPFQLGDIAEGAVEEVKTRVLQDQLGVDLADEANCDFESPAFDRPVEPPKPADKRRGLRIKSEDGETDRLMRGGLVEDRRGRRVLVQRVSTIEEERRPPARKPWTDDARPDRGERPFRPRTGDRGDDRGDRPFRPRFADRGAGEGGDRPFKPRFSDRSEGRPDRPFKPREEGGFRDRPARPRFGARSEEGGGDRPFKPRFADRSEGRGERPFKPRFEARGEEGDRPFRKRFADRGEGREDRPFRPREDRGDRPFKPRFGDRPERDGERPFKPRFSDRGEGGGGRSFRPRDEGGREGGGDRPFKPRFSDRGDGRPERSFRPRGEGGGDERGGRPFKPRFGGGKPGGFGGGRPGGFGGPRGGGRKGPPGGGRGPGRNRD
ncbi:MAG: pseudouridine synthase [Labrys sp. (in: a-proteobacteria)]